MEREDIAILAHLISSMKDAIEKLEDALKSKDIERIAAAKREILGFHEQIDKRL